MSVQHIMQTTTSQPSTRISLQIVHSVTRRLAWQRSDVGGVLQLCSFLKKKKTESSSTTRAEREPPTNYPAFPTQIDAQTEQEVCFSCQLHLVSKAVRLPPLHLALSCAPAKVCRGQCNRSSSISVSSFFFSLLPSSIKPPGCICSSFGVSNLQLRFLFF